MKENQEPEPLWTAASRKADLAQNPRTKFAVSELIQEADRTVAELIEALDRSLKRERAAIMAKECDMDDAWQEDRALLERLR